MKNGFQCINYFLIRFVWPRVPPVIVATLKPMKKARNWNIIIQLYEEDQGTLNASRFTYSESHCLRE